VKSAGPVMAAGILTHVGGIEAAVKHTLPLSRTFVYNPCVETILLQTKLYIPTRRSSLVPRPHLVAKLDGERQGKLILLSAPAGYGKTTLVTEWIDQIQKDTARVEPAEVAVCWLSLDEDDSNPQLFFSYLAAAIQPLLLGSVQALTDAQSTLPPLLQSPQPLPAKSLMAAFINDVTPVSMPFHLILDDYHAIDNPEIDRALAFLLDHMPPQMTLVITSRTDPGFPISRLRARGDLTEVRADDLRFTEAEAAQFLQQSMGLTLLPDQVAALESRTEGWIAGLQMAALSMQHRDDVTRFIAGFTGSHRFILDYLVEEVLNQQPAEVQAFLMATAVLNRLCADLCDAVRQTSPASQQILEQLDNHNIFLIPLDNERRWYRYHHLFADLLRQRLNQSAAPTAGDVGASVAELHSRASLWCEENGLETQAIHHAFAAENFERAAGLIELAWPAMDGRFESATWLGWAKELPDEIIRARPVLSVSYAWALLNGGELEAAEARLRDAERWLDATAAPTTDMGDRPETQMIVVDEAHFQTLPASIATARTYAAQALGDIPGAMKHARRALDLLPEDDYLRRGPAASLLGLMYWARGELEAAYQALADGMAGFQKVGQIPFAISGTSGLADIRVAQGRLREAVRVYEQALSLALAQGEPAIRGTTDIYLGLAELHHEQGDVETAAQYLLKNEELGENAALADWPYRHCVAQARMKAAHGELDDALDLLDEAQRLYFRSPVPDVRPIAALKTEIWIAQDKLTSALEWVRDRGLSVDDNLNYLHEFEHITLARVLIAQYKRDRTDHSILEAIGLLKRLLNAAEEGRRMGGVIQILVLQAVAHAAQGETPLARASLERALTLAEPEGYVRLFVNEGLPMAQLLSDAATHGVMPDYTGKLLAAFEIEEPQRVSKPAPPPVPSAKPLIDPLSKRELEILTLIAAGLKNKEIAEQLFISLNTVLYHIKNIYGKLGVNKRTLAITKAKELDLI